MKRMKQKLSSVKTKTSTASVICLLIERDFVKNDSPCKKQNENIVKVKLTCFWSRKRHNVMGYDHANKSGQGVHHDG